MFQRNLSRFFKVVSSAALYSTYSNASETKNYNYKYALNETEKYEIKRLNGQMIKPTVVAIYDPSHGTMCADKGINYLISKGIMVIQVPSSQGLNHPIFKFSRIDGIYLTGGLNILPDDIRTTFEEQLIELAEKDIPLMGICRGLQTLGYHNGYDVKDLETRWEHTRKDTVTVEPGSTLYTALQYKLKSDDNSPIEYPVVCMHSQHIEPNLGNNLKVTGTKHDGTIESVERSTGKFTSIAFQHHPESIGDGQSTKQLKAKLKQSEEIVKISEEKCMKAAKNVEIKEEILRNAEQEPITKAERKCSEKILNIPFYLDTEYTIFSLLEKKRKTITNIHMKVVDQRLELDREVAVYLRAKDNLDIVQNDAEKDKEALVRVQLAKAEMGLFIHQVRHHFLDRRKSKLGDKSIDQANPPENKIKTKGNIINARPRRTVLPPLVVSPRTAPPLAVPPRTAPPLAVPPRTDSLRRVSKAFLIRGGTPEQRNEIMRTLMDNDQYNMYERYFGENESAIIFSDEHSSFHSMSFQEAKRLAGENILASDFRPREQPFGIIDIANLTPSFRFR